MAQLEDAHRKLLEDPNFDYVGTVRNDGTPRPGLTPRCRSVSPSGPVRRATGSRS